MLIPKNSEVFGNGLIKNDGIVAAIILNIVFFTIFTFYWLKIELFSCNKERNPSEDYRMDWQKLFFWQSHIIKQRMEWPKILEC